MADGFDFLIPKKAFFVNGAKRGEAFALDEEGFWGCSENDFRTAASLCTACGIYCGLDSVVFAVSVVATLNVCQDAVGVRPETGKQATVINDIVEVLLVLGSKALTDEKILKSEGPTSLQVTVRPIATPSAR